MTQHTSSGHGINPLHIVFAGSSAFAAHILEILLTEGAVSGWRVSAVLTQPDRAAGRGQQRQPSPTKKLALLRKLPVHQPVSLRRISPGELCPELAPDLLVVASYGLLLPQLWLDWARFGAINIHTSLLPRWRGAAPIERAIMAGDKCSGVCVMQMEAELDTGAVLATCECRIDAEDDAPMLEQKLITSCAPLLRKVLSETQRLGQLPDAEPQPTEGVTYAHKISKQDVHIDWQKSASDIACQVRALTARGGAQTWLPDGTRLSLFKAQAGTPNDDLPANTSAGTLLPVGKGTICVHCGDGGTIKIIRARLARGKGSLLSSADLLNGFPTMFRAGVQLQHPRQLKGA